jgi:TolB-like protein
MFRKTILGVVCSAALAANALAAGSGVRVLSFAKAKDDATGAALTQGLEEAFKAKGVATAAATPEPAILQELKISTLVQGQSLDEVKGLDVGAEAIVAGSYAVSGDKLTVDARLIDIDSGEVLAAVREEGTAAGAQALGKAAGDKLAAAVSKPPEGAKVETVDVEAVGMAPEKLGSAARTVALADAKRNAIEAGVGTVVNVTKVPDLKQVKASATSTLRYRVVSETKEGGKLIVKIAANVDVPAELAAKYPAAAKEISDETGFKGYVQRSPKGEVDWEKGILRVVGRAKGAAADDAKASLLARRSAIADAYARAMEVVSAVRIDGDQSVADAEKKDKQLRVQIEGLVQGGKVVKDNPAGAGGTYEVTLEVPMRGLRGVQTVFLGSLAQPKSAKESAAAEPLAADEYTGIVIDMRGTGVEAGLFPKLMDEQGNVIADPAQTDADVLKAKGQAAYVTADKGADLGALLDHERLGERPLVMVASLAPFVIGQAAGSIDFSKRLNRRQGPKPLTVKGVSTNGPMKVNMLVSTNFKNKDQFKKNLQKVFGNSKVVIVMDSQIGGTEGRLIPAGDILWLSLRD